MEEVTLERHNNWYTYTKLSTCTQYWVCKFVPAMERKKEKEEEDYTNLTKALKNIVSCYKLLHTRTPYNDSKNGVQSRFNLWLLSQNFTWEGVTVPRVSSNQITNTS